MKRITPTTLLLLAALTVTSCKKEPEPKEASLIDIFPVEQGVLCEYGGYRFVTGLDQNENGILEATEIQDSVLLCNESDDFNTLIDTEYENPGMNCSSGGLRVLTGKDLNKNDSLESDEVEAIEYVCNGQYTNLGQKIILSFDNIPSTDKEEGIIGYTPIRYFNLLDYPGVDSASFEAYLKPLRSSTTCIVELYDVTHGVPIDCTMITSDNTTYGELVKTRYNFIDKFPESDIDLSVLIRTSEEGRMVDGDDYMLILYRSEEY